MERGGDGVGALGISWAQNPVWTRAAFTTAWDLWRILDMVDPFGQSNCTSLMPLVEEGFGVNFINS